MTQARKRLLIIWSSQTGRTTQLVDAAREGARDFADEVDTVTLRALEADVADLLAADGLIIATPENFGYLSGAVKDFLDRSYYPAEGKVDGLPYLMLVSAGNDGTGAVRALERIATGFRWKCVAEALIVRGEPDAAALASARERGALLAAGLAFGTL
ncbi:NAD(P)H-dependent oxidoreductase [Nevskia sp.]|uniref:flavodoxin family protein n=1 Tax=Nevskia sp. TaxID=1929292 RepID=UPI0025CEDE3F|nr:NAD(P)H-dependent oxidoreductase [Nevskia sp.]